jgi:hypothetical protein
LKDSTGNSSDTLRFTITIGGYVTPVVIKEVKEVIEIETPIPKITKVTNRGLITIEWSMSMKVPTANKLATIPTDIEKWTDE